MLRAHTRWRGAVAGAGDPACARARHHPWPHLPALTAMRGSPSPTDKTPRCTLHADSAGLSPCLRAGMGSPHTTDYLAPLLLGCCICASASLPPTSLGGGMTVFQPGKMMPTQKGQQQIPGPQAGPWDGDAQICSGPVASRHCPGQVFTQVTARNQHPHLQGHASTCAAEMPVPSRGRASWQDHGAGCCQQSCKCRGCPTPPG